MADDASLAASYGSTALSGNERQFEQQRLIALQREIRQLASRDREVRAHEQAHAAVGGRYAGAPRYEVERGPNGVAYAVAGSVSIDAAPVPDDPAATLEKMTVVQRAALAPAQPSAADRAIAAKAAAQAAQARAQLVTERTEQRRPGAADASEPGSGASDEASGARRGPIVDSRGGRINTRA